MPFLYPKLRATTADLYPKSSSYGWGGARKFKFPSQLSRFREHNFIPFVVWTPARLLTRNVRLAHPQGISVRVLCVDDGDTLGR